MAKVQAYVYDVTQGMAKTMSMAMVGKQIDMVPHTGIVVFGREYYFGGGAEVGEPGKTVPVPIGEVLDLGETQKTREELEAHIASVLALEHTAEKYNLLSHNCNHYADDVAKFLLGQGIPHRIVNCAEEALSTPQGQQMRGMIEGMEASMRSGGASGGLNPYANVGAAPAPVSASIPSATPVAHNEELDIALKELADSNDVEVRRLCLQTLLKITDNVAKDPAELKFRRVKMSNPAFSKKVTECNGGVDVVVAAGWLPDVTPDGEDAWVLDEDAAKRQTGTKKRLEAEIAKLSAPAAAAAAPAPAAAPAGGFGGMPGFPGGLPPGMENNPMAQQMMQNPAMMAQAQQAMQNPQMMAQAQQMMQDPAMMAQMQQMMQDPQAMARMQQMMGGMGGGGGGF